MNLHPFLKFATDITVASICLRVIHENELDGWIYINWDINSSGFG